MSFKKKIIDIIQKKGKLVIDDYISLCLYDREFGYYKNKIAIGGKGADFITAPEISQVYGELIALFIVNQWQKFSCQPVHIIEFGPGLGTLMKDMMRVFQKFNDFFKNLSIHLLEINPVLIKKQNENLSIYSCVEWYQNIEDLPIFDGFSFIVASEFFDVLPIKQYVMENGKKIERYVMLDKDENLVFSHGEDVFEECLYDELIMKGIQKCQANAFFSGLLIIDYGYIKKDFIKSTLQGLRKNKYESILQFQGENDISHHVNFLKLQELLPSCFKNSFITTQGDFLKTLGIQERLEMLRKKTKGMQDDFLLSSCARLISPQHMGDLFKVLYASSHA
jgi:NADH dehydrogenase [ubiquinone] 1 alpha subcomplex assembly factor 7